MLHELPFLGLGSRGTKYGSTGVAAVFWRGHLKVSLRPGQLQLAAPAQAECSTN
jgi:hypothetical protein